MGYLKITPGQFSDKSGTSFGTTPGPLWDDFGLNGLTGLFWLDGINGLIGLAGLTGLMTYTGTILGAISRYFRDDPRQFGDNGRTNLENFRMTLGQFRDNHGTSPRQFQGNGGTKSGITLRLIQTRSLSLITLFIVLLPQKNNSFFLSFN